MRFLLASILGIAAFCSTAEAQQPDVPPGSAPPPGSIVEKSDGGLALSPSVCAMLVQATPNAAPAVPSAEYQPGIDAEGNAVAPADLPDSSSPINTAPLAIELDSRLASRFKLPPSVSGKAILGYVELRGNEVYFNGVPLGGDQTAALRTACAEAGRR